MCTLHAINFIVARGRFSFAIIGSSFGSESSKLQSSGDITAIVTYDVLTTAQPRGLAIVLSEATSDGGWARGGLCLASVTVQVPGCPQCPLEDTD